ncbi:hypothetical protein M670_03464 [Schinkia azotoformans MEV2011]|uniref:Uncharacterized protein n=1 Tax=Schinkia azotoformans MEV2011 TaxID=1348973 RepID=A0A072NIT8_SCHAZ|nr:hypothetical protein [Schinkia azotoformans]KEF37426.1 hypothetical protein M670_03464 [Schinkia azotoformans MEV2011]MEC1694644.1 hypothetical protein [Schinkia azotoformans]MEC1725705.1 hypothetical protein [Schinkia azotoformans]
MVQFIMFSVIVAVVSALIIMPYVNKSRKDLNFSGSMIFLAAFAILLPCVFLFYYVTLHDRNFSSLWPLFIMVTFISAYMVSGAESMLKSGLFAVSVIIGVFVLTAPFFNAVGDKPFIYLFKRRRFGDCQLFGNRGDLLTSNQFGNPRFIANLRKPLGRQKNFLEADLLYPKRSKI